MTDSEPQEPGKAGRDFRDAAARHSARPARSLVLCGARLADGRTVDVRLVGERIEAVGTAGSLGTGQDSATRIDLSGYLLLPAPAEPHAHYDTALTAEPPGRPDLGRHGDSRHGDTADPAAEDVQRRTTEAALLQLSQGATALRTHVHIGDVAGLRSLAAVLQARRALRGLVDLSAVAVPRLLTGAAGAEGLSILRDAVKMGAAAVGGCPDLDPDPGGYVEAVLEVAAEHGCPVDLHTDGSDPARLARLAAAVGGLRPGVTIGPCGGLARLPHQVAQRAAGQLAAAGVTVVCLPQGNCGVLERPTPTVPSRTAPVRVLTAAGVAVAAGSGALRDAANQVGRGDPLEAAYLLASHGEARPYSAYEAISTRARAAMGLPEVRVEAGFPAELLAVRGNELAGALSLAYSRIVVHRGRVVARTSAVREYCDLVGVRELGLPRQSQG
ncbi:amidohydrolase family protein [Streptomyces sp. 8N114]|uniref:amidohydrolase family protein n=1 Tax=Streptomyces sp. 8N114 TaxID=3457419 RepID=UPI003FD0A353